MITIESPTRVTLALDVIRRISDGAMCGYHELGIIKHQVALADTLRVEPLPRGTRDVVECDDPRVPCDGTNICVKACELVRRELFSSGGYLRIVIDKKIPVQGGMAGGSANAAAMLLGLNELWGLDLSQEKLRDLGRCLGMDVPFFFPGGTAFDSEATGVIKPINTNLKFHIILAIPDFGVSTKGAYDGIDYSRIGKNISHTDKMIKALEGNDQAAALACMHNDFEISVFERHPRLKEIRDDLLNEGCLAAGMSGSGSTIIGIANDKYQAESIAARIDCKTIITKSF